MPNFIPLTSTAQVDEFLRASEERSVTFFKHSTSCSISSLAKARLERALPEATPVVLLDLLRHREVSDYLATVTGVRHESPQLLVVSAGEVTYAASHLDIEPSHVLA